MSASSGNSFAPATLVLRVKGVDGSVAYYLHSLGFQLRWGAGKEFACVARDKCSIFLTDDNQSRQRMWLWVGEYIRDLHAQYLISNAIIRNRPNNFEWALEMQIEDLDGNVLRIGSTCRER